MPPLHHFVAPGLVVLGAGIGAGVVMQSSSATEISEVVPATAQESRGGIEVPAPQEARDYPDVPPAVVAAGPTAALIIPPASLPVAQIPPARPAEAGTADPDQPTFETVTAPQTVLSAAADGEPEQTPLGDGVSDGSFVQFAGQTAEVLNTIVAAFGQGLPRPAVVPQSINPTVATDDGSRRTSPNVDRKRDDAGKSTSEAKRTGGGATDGRKGGADRRATTAKSD
ncbi:hypothetical protein BH11ACT6_BH11ACT6_23060 [soil metagenome]